MLPVSSSRHPVQTTTTTRKPDGLPIFIMTDSKIAALLRVSTSTIVLARHGKAPKLFDEQRDGERMLNDKGIDQAKQLGQRIGTTNFDVVLSSPLKRVEDTLSIATGGRQYVINSVPELTIPDNSEHPIMIMFNALSYSPMCKYIEHPLGEQLKHYGRTALETILARLNTEKVGQKILIGGHAVLLNALVWAMADPLELEGGMNASQLRIMALETSLGECEAFEITLRLGSDTALCRHIKLD